MSAIFKFFTILAMLTSISGANFRSTYTIDKGTSHEAISNRAYRGFCVKMIYLKDDYLSEPEGKAYGDINSFTKGVLFDKKYTIRDEAIRNACKKALNLSNEPKNFKNTIYKYIKEYK